MNQAFFPSSRNLQSEGYKTNIQIRVQNEIHSLIEVCLFIQESEGIIVQRNHGVCMEEETFTYSRTEGFDGRDSVSDSQRGLCRCLERRKIKLDRQKTLCPVAREGDECFNINVTDWSLEMLDTQVGALPSLTVRHYSNNALFGGEPRPEL